MLRLPTPPEPTRRVMVAVTFLRMEHIRAGTGASLPPGCDVLRVNEPTVAFYRYLYNTVGEAHLWWLRRVLQDAEIAGILRAPTLSLHVLYRNGAPAGFYELDRFAQPAINLSYFGLMPHAVGQGLGRAFLQHAIDTAWAEQPSAITVNTCSADNPRALPNYIAAGFTPVREVREAWNIPIRLGLQIPPHLR